MALRNRVTPMGEIVADPGRGLFMGNRGVLHDDNKVLGPARWKHQNWVTCRLRFKGRRRTLMTPRRYTELFFLDEAVALAAGHRPCGECRRRDYNAFLDLWADVHGHRPDAKAFDRALHAERAVPGARRQRRHRSMLFDLPDGAFVLNADNDPTPYLVWGETLVPYAPGGYGAPVPARQKDVVVLTPPSTLAVLEAGYAPVMHGSLG
ncbi:MAG: hypothetical protein OXR84_04885 [Magnetovibrio sp.]|nr:hypothetical protein [Magnetovibrio sp.]